jgi:hypothetical protein
MKVSAIRIWINRWRGLKRRYETRRGTKEELLEREQVLFVQYLGKI